MKTIIFDKVSFNIIDQMDDENTFVGLNPAYAVLYTDVSDEVLLDLMGSRLEDLLDLMADRLDEIVDELEDALWKACRLYEKNLITDNLSSIYWFERNNSVKAQANIDWKDALWAEYYRRKAEDVTNLDFSIMGNPSYSYPEVRAELGL